MNNAIILLVVLAAVLAVFGGLAVVIPRLVKKGIDISGVLVGTGTVLETADTVVDTLQEFFPDVPAFALIDKVIGWAQKGAEAAEQLYKTSKIEEAQRKDEATRLVYEFIAAAGVELLHKPFRRQYFVFTILFFCHVVSYLHLFSVNHYLPFFECRKKALPKHAGKRPQALPALHRESPWGMVCSFPTNSPGPCKKGAGI